MIKGLQCDTFLNFTKPSDTQCSSSHLKDMVIPILYRILHSVHTNIHSHTHARTVAQFHIQFQAHANIQLRLPGRLSFHMRNQPAGHDRFHYGGEKSLVVDICMSLKNRNLSTRVSGIVYFVGSAYSLTALLALSNKKESPVKLTGNVHGTKHG